VISSSSQVSSVSVIADVQFVLLVFHCAWRRQGWLGASALAGRFWMDLRRAVFASRRDL
jgi:hypothetical protein